MLMYDRIPAGSAEIRKASDVVSGDGHHVGHVRGVALDADGSITHLVLDRGHLWAHREMSIPIGDVDAISTDVIRLLVRRRALRELPSAHVTQVKRGRSHHDRGSFG